MATSLFSATDLNQQGSPVAGPMAVFVAVRPRVSDAAALRSLGHVAAVLDRTSDPDAPIAEWSAHCARPRLQLPHRRRDARAPRRSPGRRRHRRARADPVASVRQRRRQFALLKTLGFTRGQIAASVAWQSSVAAVVGVVIGVPTGVALGRWLWTLFADGIAAVPHPAVPVLSVARSPSGRSPSPTWSPSSQVGSPPGRAPRYSCGRSDRIRKVGEPWQ